MLPRNRHVREKVRQTLQRLRGDGFLFFIGNAIYELNTAFKELDGDPISPGEAGIELPQTRVVVRQIRLRCTLLAADMKRRYKHACQVCGSPVVLYPGVNYAEGHHLRPLGTPHLGPDVPGNILVLCPNHHIMFDRGALTIIPETFDLRHVVEGVIPHRAQLAIARWHQIDPKHVDYHNRVIFRGAEGMPAAIAQQK
ncbi:MAG TPA: HNH endonuclease [Planctomycetaceae bacterium]|jgi:predicted restriction endonuclease